MLVVPVTVVVPVMEVVPFVTVKFLPVATVVSPFRVTAPVPVLNVPLLADWSKLPVPAAKVMFWLAAILTFLFKFIWVALVVPMFRATAVAVSTSGVRTLVSALPVPEIQKTPFSQGLSNQTKLKVFQIPEPTVDEFARCLGRSRSKVTLLE
jgi:hypothetical protein